MTDHIKTRKKLQSIPTKLEFNTLLDSIVLSDKERQMMQLYYVERKDFDYIADELGYTKSGILRMHKRVLKRIEALI
jgi:DNA-directed RNA polymerase specialized sigma subunit